MSKADLTSKFLGFLRQGLSLTNDQTSQQLSLDDELCETFSKISDSFVCILDNADDLLETGSPNVKDEVIDLLGKIMTSNEKVKFLLTSRESLQFVDLRFPGHKGSRIGQLDDISSQELVHKLLPMASVSDCKKITQVCGHVPLAIKLLCSSILEDGPVELSQYLENYLEASTDIIQMLDNPDYPNSMRLQVLFGTSFQRLSEEEKRALVSLAILPDSFDVDIATAVLGLANTARTNQVLKRLRRKSLLDSGTRHGLFSMHKLIQTYSREKGEQEMQETVSRAKSRIRAYYVKLFQTLNEEFHRGQSMSAFINLGYLGMHYLVTNESEEGVKCFHEALSVMSNIPALILLKLIIYQILAVYYQCRNNPKSASYYQKKALQECECTDNQYLVIPTSTREPKAREEQTTPKDQANAPLLMQVLYYVSQTTENFSDVDSQQHFGNIALEILNNGAASCEPSVGLFKFHRIAAKMLEELQTYEEVVKFAESAITSHRTALQQCKRNESSLSKEGDDEVHSVRSSRIHEEALVGNYQDLGQLHYSKGNYSASLQSQQLALDLALAVFGEEDQATATCYYLVGWAHFQLEDYTSALPYNQRALKIRRKLLGEDHPLTAYSYRSVGYTQHELGDYKSALRSKQRELDIRLKLFGEEASETADSYRSLGQTYNEIRDYNSALPLKQHEVAIRRKVFGEEHLKTADSHHSMGGTQHQLGDHQSARLSFQRALDTRLKLLGEEHADTAESYHELGVTQHQLGNYTSAFQSKKHAVDVRLKLFGEEHLQTAASWHELGVTQHEQGDYASARQSLQHALDIRVKLLGEEHAETAKSSHLLKFTYEATL